MCLVIKLLAPKLTTYNIFASLSCGINSGNQVLENWSLIVASKADFRRIERLVHARHVRDVTQDQLVLVDAVHDGVDDAQRRIRRFRRRRCSTRGRLVHHANGGAALGRQAFARLQEEDVIGRLDLKVLVVRIRLNGRQVDHLSQDHIVISGDTLTAAFGIRWPV